MTVGSIRAGKAHILLSIRNNTQQGLKLAQRQLTSFSKSAALAGAGLVAAAGAGGKILGSAVTEFSRVEQLLGRFGSVFGDLSKQSGAFADKLATDVNTSRLEIRDILAQYQGIAQGQGFSPIQAQDISQELTKLTYDLIAFDDNLESTQQAVDRISSVFTGEARPLRRYGADFRKEVINIEEAVEGLNLLQTESLARFKQFREVSFDVGITGQAIREVNTLASLLRGFNAAARDTKASVGGTIGPAIASLTGGFTQVVRAVEKFSQTSPRAFQRIALAVPAVGALGVGLLGLSTALFAAGAAFGTFTSLAAPAAALGTIGLAVFEITQNFDALRGTVESVVGSMRDQLDELQNLTTRAFDGIADALVGGRIQLAADIAATAVKIAFVETFGEIRLAYNSFVTDMAKGLVEINGILDSLGYAAYRVSEEFYRIPLALVPGANALIPRTNPERADTTGVLGALDDAQRERERGQRDELDNLQRKFVMVTRIAAKSRQEAQAEKARQTEIAQAERRRGLVESNRRKAKRLAEERDKIAAEEAAEAAKAQAKIDAKAQREADRIARKRQAKLDAFPVLQGQGTFGGLNIAQQLAPQIDKLAAILEIGKVANNISSDILEAIEDAPVVRWQ